MYRGGRRKPHGDYTNCISLIILARRTPPVQHKHKEKKFDRTSRKDITFCYDQTIPEVVIGIPSGETLRRGRKQYIKNFEDTLPYQDEEVILEHLRLQTELCNNLGSEKDSFVQSLRPFTNISGRSM